MEKLGVNLGYLLVFTCAFGVMFVVLRNWVFKPLLGQLEKRREVIARGLEDARVAAEARANAEKEANRIVAEAQTKAAEVIREATERAEKVEQEIRVQAEAEVTKGREAAMAEMEGERNRMLSELRGQIATLAMAAANKLVSESLDEHRQRKLVNEFFSGICDGRITLLEDLPMSGGNYAEVISALPLSDGEQSALSGEIRSKMGTTASVSFRVDPSILGGLIVRVGDRVVDGSVSGRLEDLRQSLR